MNRRRFVQDAMLATISSFANVQLFALPEKESIFDGRDTVATDKTGDDAAFPTGFLFGAATSCVQIEGAAAEEGKGESIWDRFCLKRGAIRDGSNPSIACNSYHRWFEDIELLKLMGLQSYRMSISWPRIFPDGKGRVNQKGLDHYSAITDALRENGIKPLITCYHWDLPQALEDAGGWPNRDTAARFSDYAALLAKTYGDRVEHWCLLNELQAFTVAGYGWGVHAPGVKDRGMMLRATHTANLAQAAGFHALKAERSSLQIGIAHDLYPVRPASQSDPDRRACERFDAFRNRWFLEPAFTGEYPKAFVDGNPYEAMGFRSGDEALLRAQLDYTGINYYGGLGIVAAGEGAELFRGLNAHEVKERSVKFYRNGMKEVLLELQRSYKRPIIITETGYDEPEQRMLAGHVHDPARIRYLHSMLLSLCEAINEGADVRAVHIWSLIDDWEWNDGFQARIGLAQVDFKNPGKRALKDSGYWYRQIVSSKKIPLRLG
jgi:beta-glucosidase